MLLYPITVLVGAFLLFQVQPIVARMLLPWFGGTAAVWSACLLFFQSVLLLGYAYAHGLNRFGNPRTQSVVHAAVLLVSLAALPILPAAHWKPAGGEDPTLRILLLLAATVGLPYFALAATSPLLQAWLARERGPQGVLSYRLYALSNTGSMLALLTYPFAVEPLAGSRQQALYWSGGYVLFVAACILTALRAGRSRVSTSPEAATPGGTRRPGWAAVALWMALPLCASALLLAVTSHLTQNIAPMPFLWVAPLCLYLLSFIICFERDEWYVRGIFLPLLTAALAFLAYTVAEDVQNATRLRVMVPASCAALFVCCMVCHGELAKLRPHPRYLTHFYLAVAAGGALGGAFVALAAPRLFDLMLELPVSLVACALFPALAILHDRGFLVNRCIAAVFAAQQGAVIIALALYLAAHVRAPMAHCRVTARNFYGSLRVTEHSTTDGKLTYRALTHGTITHGEQLVDPVRRREPITYYGPRSGIVMAVRDGQRRPHHRVGVFGLGAGTMAAFGRPGDTYRFYEINPLVVQVARSEFTYLSDCPAEQDVILGDARLSLEREPPQRFDLLVMDAFASDSIPTHLVTREALELYFRHLRPGGIVAVNASNRYLTLEPVLRRAAEALGKHAMAVENGNDVGEIFQATWVLITEDRSLFEREPLRSAARPLRDRPGVRLWTDDYSNLFQILK